MLSSGRTTVGRRFTFKRAPMQHVHHSKHHFTPYQPPRQDNRRKQQGLNNVNTRFEEFNLFTGTRLKPGTSTVLLTILMLGGLFVEQAEGAKVNSGSKTGESKNSDSAALPHQSLVCSADISSLLPHQHPTCSVDNPADSFLTLTLAQLLDTKLKVDAEVLARAQELLDEPITEAELYEGLQCEQIKNKILQTAQDLPSSEPRFKQVISQEEFSLRCAPSNFVEVYCQGANACFHPQSKTIYCSPEKLENALLSHEFIHAANFFSHMSTPYAENDVDAMMPFYPPTEENCERYRKALDKGDRRVKDFKTLTNKARKKEKLSRAEVKRFQVYEQAAQDCLAVETIFITSREPYTDLLKRWKPGMDFSLQMGEAILNIVNMKETQEGMVQFTLLMNAVDAVCARPTVVNDALQLEQYRNLPEKMKLAERDAYTFENFSGKGMKTFYPEAYEMRTHKY